ncbi:hypothetical protein B0H21DRAFT_736943 [Amylocystis lapponica]|nr:hypothetical protein B0H21DRAFT_736943 [Amylocystis lapponica]
MFGTAVTNIITQQAAQASTSRGGAATRPQAPQHAAGPSRTPQAATRAARAEFTANWVRAQFPGTLPPHAPVRAPVRPPFTDITAAPTPARASTPAPMPRLAIQGTSADVALDDEHVGWQEYERWYQNAERWYSEEDKENEPLEYMDPAEVQGTEEVGAQDVEQDAREEDDVLSGDEEESDERISRVRYSAPTPSRPNKRPSDDFEDDPENVRQATRRRLS